MSASDQFDAGRLREAIDEQTKAVKAKPADANARLFLFELLAFAGDWERARKQLDAVKYEQEGQVRAVELYRLVLDAEEARRKVFAGTAAPDTFGPPPPQVDARIEAVKHLATNRPDEALAAISRAAETTPTVDGTFNGKPVDHLRDADDLFAGILEVFWRGRYLWVPLEQVQTVACNAPKTPRDLLWAPARLTLSNGWTNDETFLPVLYPGSWGSDDDRIKLGRLTDWKTTPGAPTLGVGAHLLLAGDEDVSILEIRELVLGASG